MGVEEKRRIAVGVRRYLDSKAGHLHPQAVSKGLQTSLRDAVGGHVEAGEEREDARSKEHPACSTYQRMRGGGEEEKGGEKGGRRRKTEGVEGQLGS